MDGIPKLVKFAVLNGINILLKIKMTKIKKLKQIFLWSY